MMLARKRHQIKGTYHRNRTENLSNESCKWFAGHHVFLCGRDHLLNNAADQSPYTPHRHMDTRMPPSVICLQRACHVLSITTYPQTHLKITFGSSPFCGVHLMTMSLASDKTHFLLSLAQWPAFLVASYRRWRKWRVSRDLVTALTSYMPEGGGWH